MKTSMDVAVTLGFNFIMPWWIGLIIAHTVNYCINGQAICVFYHIQAGNIITQKFCDDMMKMYNRLQKDSHIAVAISYGSLSKGGWHNSSDIGIRFVPQKGEWNFWKTCFVGLRERALAFFRKYPLDMYIFSLKHSHEVMNKNEMPIIFKDVDDEGKNYYQELMSFDDFKIMFKKEHLK